MEEILENPYTGKKTLRLVKHLKGQDLGHIVRSKLIYVGSIFMQHIVQEVGGGNPVTDTKGLGKNVDLPRRWVYKRSSIQRN